MLNTAVSLEGSVQKVGSVSRTRNKTVTNPIISGVVGGVPVPLELDTSILTEGAEVMVGLDNLFK